MHILPPFFVSVYPRSRLTYISSLAETDFLTSDVMHGEGNLLAHLVIVGFKVFYVQVCSLKYVEVYLHIEFQSGLVGMVYNFVC